MINNEATISGEIISDYMWEFKYYDEDFYSTKIYCRQNSVTLKILVSAKNNFIDKKIVGKYCCINGSIKLYNNEIVIEAEKIIISDETVALDVNCIKLYGYVYKCNIINNRHTLLDITINRNYDSIKCILPNKCNDYCVNDNVTLEGRIVFNNELNMQLISLQEITLGDS